MSDSSATAAVGEAAAKLERSAGGAGHSACSQSATMGLTRMRSRSRAVIRPAS